MRGAIAADQAGSTQTRGPRSPPPSRRQAGRMPAVPVIQPPCLGGTGQAHPAPPTGLREGGGIGGRIRSGMAPPLVSLSAAATYAAAASSEVQFGQRVAASGMLLWQ